mgnify:CR=1 FL=1
MRLSGGQAQRLALARTLCHLRPVMILDDPFSALDKKTEAEIFSNIRQLAGDAIVLLISPPAVFVSAAGSDRLDGGRQGHCRAA